MRPDAAETGDNPGAVAPGAEPCVLGSADTLIACGITDHNRANRYLALWRSVPTVVVPVPTSLLPGAPAILPVTVGFRLVGVVVAAVVVPIMITIMIVVVVVVVVILGTDAQILGQYLSHRIVFEILARGFPGLAVAPVHRRLASQLPDGRVSLDHAGQGPA